MIEHTTSTVAVVVVVTTASITTVVPTTTAIAVAPEALAGAGASGFLGAVRAIPVAAPSLFVSFKENLELVESKGEENGSLEGAELGICFPA